MGLGVTVGALADLLAHDPEGAGWLVAELDAVNAALRNAGLPLHNEPEACDVWSADGYSYSGLHSLREVAGLHGMGQPIPRTHAITSAEGTPYGDTLFNRALEFLHLGNAQGRSVDGAPPFMHLIVHSDAHGYYVPIEFGIPVLPEVMDEETSHIWPLGSTQRLAAEVAQLCTLLEIPDELHVGHDDILNMLDDPSNAPDVPLWQAQPIAAYSAVLLRAACTASLRAGAAIAFG